MTTLNEAVSRWPISAGKSGVELTAQFTAEGDVTSAIEITGPVTAQGTGPVNAATVAIQRASLQDPDNFVEVVDETGAAAGVAASFAGVGTWRYRLANKATFGPANEILNRTLQNIADAINGLQAYPVGQFAAGSDPVPTVNAEVTGDGELTVTAITPGTAGNAITTTFTPVGAGDGAWGAATLENGAAAVAAGGTLTFSGQPSLNDTVTINGRVYTFKTTLTGAADEVARGANQAASEANLTAAINASGAAAVGTITFTGQPTDGQWVRIGDVRYFFVAALTAVQDVPFQVLIGASAQATRDNLTLAINGTKTGKGTSYSNVTPPLAVATAANVSTDQITVTSAATGAAGQLTSTDNASNVAWGAATLASTAGAGVTYGLGTVINADVSAVDGAGTVTVAAKVAGTAGNAITTTESSGVLAWGGATLASGAEAVAASGVFTSTADLEEDDEIEVGGVTYTMKDALTPAANEVLVAGTLLNVTLTGEEDRNA